MSPYAAIVGTAPADTSEVNATWLGKIVHRRAAAKIKMTVTALRGCPCASTCPIHPDKGSTPSRATANTKRDEATIATVVFYESQGQQECEVAT